MLPPFELIMVGPVEPLTHVPVKLCLLVRFNWNERVVTAVDSFGSADVKAYSNQTI